MITCISGITAQLTGIHPQAMIILLTTIVQPLTPLCVLTGGCLMKMMALMLGSATASWAEAIV